MKYANTESVMMTDDVSAIEAPRFPTGALTAALAIAAVTVLLASTALGATESSALSAKNLPSGTEVTLSGTVEDFDSGNIFTLRDKTGAVKVDMSTAKPIVLKNGQTVSMTGVVDKGLLTTDIAATDISVDKSVGERVGNAIDSITGDKPDSDAKTVSIQSLPESGLVKISGIVDSVSSQKKFTLRDQTGKINVALKSSESAALSKGSEVTVVGYVDKGLFGKSINATDVEVDSSGAPVAAR